MTSATAGTPLNCPATLAPLKYWVYLISTVLSKAREYVCGWLAETVAFSIIFYLSAGAKHIRGNFPRKARPITLLPRTIFILCGKFPAWAKWLFRTTITYKVKKPWHTGSTALLRSFQSVSYTHLRAHETDSYLV